MEHNHSSRLSRKDSWEGYSHVDLKWIVSNGGKFNIRVESVKGGRTWAQSE